MRISDWSSDVCSSDLLRLADLARAGAARSRIDGQPDLPDAKHRRRRAELRVAASRGRWLAAGRAARWLRGRRRPARRACGLDGRGIPRELTAARRSEEHTSELQSLMRISYAVFCLKKKNDHKNSSQHIHHTTHTQ